MKVVDVRQSEAERKKRYEEVCDFVDAHWGREKVFANGREFRSEDYNEIFIDICGVKPKIKMSLHEQGCTLDIRNKDYFERAQLFGLWYEAKFIGEEVTLRHNF